VDIRKPRFSFPRASQRNSFSRSLAAALLLVLIASPLNPLTPASPVVAATISNGVCEQSVGSSLNVEVTTLFTNGVATGCQVRFTSGSNSWTVPYNVSSIRLLVVGGGGGGGSHVGGGGGGGAVYEHLTYGVTPRSNISLTVGAGGGGALSSDGICLNLNAFNGEQSTFGGLTILGGGRGATWDWQQAQAGANGGGGSASKFGQSWFDGAQGGASTGSSGFKGGNGLDVLGNPSVAQSNGYPAGGGAGAGGNGFDVQGLAGGNGGPGALSTITNTRFGGGGGGGFHGWASDDRINIGGSGGSGGGGQGNGAIRGVSAGKATSGSANTGGGGGGSGGPCAQGDMAVRSEGGNGGSGVVLLQYTLNSPAISSKPVLSGTATQGRALKTSQGLWSNAPTSYRYQWQVSSDQTTWTNISGATSNGFVLTSEEAEKYVRVNVTATNPSGSSTASSDPVGPVAAAASAACAQDVTTPSTVRVTEIVSDGTVTGCVVTFTSGTNTWTKPTGVSSVRALVIGGGGAGGSGIGGGGGAGEVLEVPAHSLTQSSYEVVVGARGFANHWGPGGVGGDTSFSTFTAYGGGGGGFNENIGPVKSGGPSPFLYGSQGGGSYANTWTSRNTANTADTRLFGNSPRSFSDGTVGRRNNGGVGSAGGGDFATGGGGGGAGGDGGAGLYTEQAGGNGGSGIAIDITGTIQFYAAGGGGGVNGHTGALSRGIPGFGGSGIGGDGGGKAPNCVNRDGGAKDTTENGCWGLSGVANTGSGGGGASNARFGGDGGSGVVIIRYALASQSALSVSSTTATFGASQTLATSGGSGSGAVTYSVTNAGTAQCSVSGETLSFTAAGTCTVTATKASASGYLSTSTSATTVTVSQAAMDTPSSLTVAATAEQANSIDVSWPAVTNADTYYVKLFRADNEVEVAELEVTDGETSATITSADYADIALVQNYKVTVRAASSTGNYLSGAQSSAVAVSTNVAQSTLTVSSTVATFGSTRTLTSAGGSGTGAVTFAVTSAGTANCSITSGVLSYTAAGSCTVTATKAASSGYISASSVETTITVNPAAMGTVSTPTVVATPGELNSIDVSWTAVTNADRYQIKLFRNGVVVAYEFVDNATSYTLTADDYGSMGQTRNYAVTVEAYSTTGNYAEGAPSTSVAVTTNESFTVTYSYAGATGGNSTTTSTFITGATALTLPTPTRNGFAFGGWYTTSTEGTKIGDGGDSYSPSSTITLHARWSANSNTVTFNNNTGSGTMESQTVVTDQPTDLNANSFTKTGYVFSGWNTAADGTGTPYANNQSVALDANLTLFAQWSAGTYTVTYNYNGANGGNGSATGSFTTGGTALTLPVPTRTGYTFDGWFESPTFAGTALGATYSPSASATIHASWTQIMCSPTSSQENGYTVYRFGSPGTCEWTIPSLPTSSIDYLVVGGGGGGGYGFDSVGGGGGAGGQVKAGTLDLGSTVTLSVGAGGAAGSLGGGGAGQNSSFSNITSLGGGGGCGSRNRCANAGRPATADSAATGGIGGSGGSSPLSSTGGGGSNTAGATTTTTAGGSGLAYDYSGSSVTYGAGGTGGVTISGAVGGNTGAAGPANTGTGGGGGSPRGATPNILGGAGGSGLVLVRVANSNTVTYDSNGGTAVVDGSFLTGGSIASAPTAPTKSSFTFLGWSATDGGSVVSFPYTPSATSGITLYATWTQSVMTITYDANGATGAAERSSESYNYGATAVTLPGVGTMTKAGYTFDGWALTNGGTKITGTVSPSVDTTYFARWVAVNYSVTYSSQESTGGAVPTDALNYNIGDTAVVKTNSGSLAKVGYSLAGWTVNSDGTGTVYVAGDSYVFGSQSVTFYPKWSAGTNTVTFSAGGGSGSISNQLITTDVATTLTSNTFTRTGYTFAGWATTSGGSVVYADGASVTITGGMDLVAVWTANSNTVTFSAGDGSGTMSNQSITTDVATALTSNTFTRTGYTFAGWSTTLNGSLAFANNASVTITSGLDLFALWTPNSNTVTFSSGGGTGSMSNQVIITDVATALTSNTFIRTGYTFSGWATSQGGSVVYANGASVTITGDMNLVAVWGPLTNTVTFNANDGSGSPATSTQSIVSGAGTALTANGFTRTGYTFAGWNTSALGTGTSYTNSQSVTLVSDLNLFAQWTPNTYTVTYNVDGATGSPSRASESFTVGTTALTLPTRGSMQKTGFDFAGWSESQNGPAISGTYSPTATITLYALWTAATFNITYNTNSATTGSPSATSSTYTTGGPPITLATQSTMARAGYTFQGWSTTRNDASTKITNSGSYTITSSVILFALWDAVDYTVTYSNQDSTGGTVPIDATSYNIGQSAVIKANTGNLAKTGYSFAGWTVASNGSGTVYQSGSTYEFTTQSITLYPQWSPNTYSIAYSPNGATGSPSSAPASYTTGDTGISLPNVGTMTKTGYDFAGWSTSPTGSALPNNGFTTTSHRTLHAVWTLKSINYSFVRGIAGGVTLTGSEIALFPNTNLRSGLYGSSQILPRSADVSSSISVSSNAYQFMGWNDGNTIYQSGDTFILGESPSTFTAQWVRLYEVRYALNGGSGVIDRDNECTQAGNTCLAGQSIGLHEAPTRDGYTFTGWEDQSGNSFSAGQQNVPLTENSFIFYAQWEVIDYSMRFDVLGGSATVSTLTKNFGDSFAMPSPGTRTGYSFSGWTDGTITLGTGAGFVVGSSNKAFTAVWTPNTYVVSYDWAGGSGTPVSNVSYTYGSSGITLPDGSSHTRDGFVFAGWSTTSQGASVGATFVPTQDTLLYARWLDGAYAMNLNTRGGTLNQTAYSVSRGSQVTLPTPTREGFVFEGWFADSATTNLVAAVNSTITPTQSQTLHAKWIQNSLAGINPAHINSLATINIAGAHTWSGNHSQSGTGAALSIPEGALPNATELKVSFVEDHTRPRELIHDSYAYYSSVVVHWLTGSGDSATVPPTAANKPITLTLTNPSILPGAKVFMILGGVATQVGEATEAGTVTIEITEDPEFVIAATPPALPASLSATQVAQNKSTVSWTAPTSNGGSPVTGYTATASPGGATCTTTELTCEITGLSSGVTYNYSVLATNAIGNSPLRNATVAYVPAPAPNPTDPAPGANTAPTQPLETPSGSISTNRGAASEIFADTEEAAPEKPETTQPNRDDTETVADAPVEAQNETVRSESVALWWLWISVALLLAALVIIVNVRRARRPHSQSRMQLK